MLAVEELVRRGDNGYEGYTLMPESVLPPRPSEGEVAEHCLV